MTEQEIFAEFYHGDLSNLDAIEALQKLGHAPKEAERIVDEWLDGLEKSQDTRSEA